eukprot:6185479-Pleurochrysis_carterae.AAC.1
MGTGRNGALPSAAFIAYVWLLLSCFSTVVTLLGFEASLLAVVSLERSTLCAQHDCLGPPPLKKFTNVSCSGLMASFPDIPRDGERQAARVVGTESGCTGYADLDEMDLALFAAATHPAGAVAGRNNGLDNDAVDELAGFDTAGSLQPSARELSADIPGCGAGNDAHTGASRWAEIVASAHVVDPGAQYCDMRGKHNRAGTQKTVPWN